MTDDSHLKMALAAFLATHGVKLVHVWDGTGGVNAMLEWPYDPTRKKPLPTEKHVTGVGDTVPAAVVRGLELLGHGRLVVRLFLLGRVL